MRVLLLIAALALAGCAMNAQRFNSRTVSDAGSPAIASATFCEVMAAQGGAVTWSKADTRTSKERADKLNAVWKLCPQYQAIVTPGK